MKTEIQPKHRTSGNCQCRTWVLFTHQWNAKQRTHLENTYTPNWSRLSTLV